MLRSLSNHLELMQPLYLLILPALFNIIWFLKTYRNLPPFRTLLIMEMEAAAARHLHSNGQGIGWCLMTLYQTIWQTSKVSKTNQTTAPTIL
jgi:hypothetical protein